jgi:hypothetical protein
MTTIIHPVDLLGEIQAQITDLENQAEEIKARLIAKGRKAYEGDFFRATVSRFDRTTLPIKVARAKLERLGVPVRWFRDNSETDEVIVVKVTARTGELLAA